MQARRLLQQTHVSRPGLEPAVRHLLIDCLRPVATGRCAVCSKRVLPSDASKMDRVPSSLTVLRLYCGHMYHTKCIEDYVKSPPFGKPCPTCGEAISHHRLLTDVKTLEGRWAAQQARIREIEDAADLMRL